MGHDKKDEWDLAIRFRDIQRFGYLEPKQKKEMSEKAIEAVLNRARESLGPIQKPYHEIFTSEFEDPHARYSGELDVEETLSHVYSKNQNEPIDAVYRLRKEKNHGLLMLLDTSLSMKGEKLALLGMTVAAVAMSVPPESFSVMGFDSEIHAIKKFNEKLPVSECVERVLSIPPGGFTNIEIALNQARAWIQESAYHQARVILISDGRYTEGKNPVDVAQGIPFLYTVKIGKDPTGREVMREIADTGLGRFTEVREMSDLPRTLLNSVRMWVK